MSPVAPFPTQPREGQPSPTAEVQKQTLLDYLAAFSLVNQLTQEEKVQFIEVAQAFTLNPFKREIHVAVYGEGEYLRMSIVVGYQVYLDRAERIGQLDGWRAWVESQGEDMKALVEIHRKDWHSPFVHEVYWKECVQRKRDGTQTHSGSRCPSFSWRGEQSAKASGRFSDELGALSNDASELPDAEAIQSLQNRISTFLNEHYTSFTEKYQDWILSMAYSFVNYSRLFLVCLALRAVSIEELIEAKKGRVIEICKTILRYGVDEC